MACIACLTVDSIISLVTFPALTYIIGEVSFYCCFMFVEEIIMSWHVLFTSHHFFVTVLFIIAGPLIEMNPALQHKYAHIHAKCHDLSQRLWARVANATPMDFIRGDDAAIRSDVRL